jgi:hypothetical protein
MASHNLLTPESEIHLPRVRTVDRDRSEQRAHAWLQRYGVRDSRHTAVKYLSYEDDKPPAEGSDDTPFIREKADDISGDSQQVVQEAASFDRNKLPDGIFRSGTFPVGTCAVEPVGKGTVQQFPPPVVTMPQTDRHSQISSDVAVEGVYMNQRKDPSDIILQGTFQARQYSTRYYGRHFPTAGTFNKALSNTALQRFFSPRHFSVAYRTGVLFSKYYARPFLHGAYQEEGPMNRTYPRRQVSLHCTPQKFDIYSTDRYDRAYDVPRDRHGMNTIRIQSLVDI